MLKNKKFVWTSLATLILIVICIVVFGSYYFNVYAQNIENESKISSIYNDSKIDFIIPSPSLEQIEDLKAEEHINDVFPCYTVYTSFESPQRNINTYVLLLEDTDKLNCTFFKDSRIKASTNTLSENSLLIDEVFAKQYGLSLGDQIQWTISSTQSVKMVVDRIYFENTFDDVRTIAFLQGEQGEIIQALTKDAPLIPNSAYIDSSDIEKTNESLKTYQPLGLKRTADEFDTYTMYEEYLEDFNSVNYYLQIQRIENFKTENFSKAEMYQKIADTQLLLFVIVIFVCSLIFSFVIHLIFGVSSSIISLIQEDGSYKSSVCTFVLSRVIVAIVCSVTSIIFTSFSLKNAMPFSILTALPIALAIAIVTILQVQHIKKAVRVKK